MSMIDDWINRQKTAVLDWIRRQLGLPDPYAPEPGEPDVPTPPPDATIQGSHTFLWKPVSESNGKVATLFPCEYRLPANDPDASKPGAKIIVGIEIVGGDRDGERTNGYWPNGNNGNRIHARWDKPGKDYGKNFDVVLYLKSGEQTKAFRVKDGAKRQG